MRQERPFESWAFVSWETRLTSSLIQKDVHISDVLQGTKEMLGS